MPQPHETFRAAAASKDPAALAATLAPDAVFRSPAVHRPVEGAEAVGVYLHAVTRTFEEFRYTDEFVDGDRAVLVFEATVGEREVQGIDMLRFDVDGRVAELTVMLRPMRGLEATVARMGEVLAELTA